MASGGTVTGFPAKLPKGTNTYQVTVTGKKNAVKAGIIAAQFTAVKKAALKHAVDTMNKFIITAPNTPTTTGGSAVVVFQQPPYYNKRLVKTIDPQTLVLLNVFYRLYLSVKVKV